MNTRAALSGFREDAPKRVLDKLISRRHYAGAEAEAWPDINPAEWLRRKEYVYTSPAIHNEIINVMGLQVLRDICADRQSSPFLTVMANETTDSSNRGQITLILRRVTQELKIGIYHNSHQR